VLVVDDEPLVRRSLERMLRPHHDVTALESVSVALRRIDAGERWDAILCDLMMSDLDGIALHAALAGRHPSLLPRLAFITGGAFGDRAEAFLSEHQVTVIAKPPRREDLLDAVERLAGSGS
jgi:CheY-like chemotaxis protein